jgi:ABC-2 type transport system ATP-binding protein
MVSSLGGGAVPLADVVRTEGLTKYYLNFWGNKTVILNDLNISISDGETFGFVGPNGAGKTTTIKLLLGLYRPSKGRAWIYDRPAGDVGVKNLIGYLPEGPYYYDFLTPEELLSFYGKLSGLDPAKIKRRSDELLEIVGLSGARKLQLRKFSKGMLQRVGLAQALVSDPKLLILDEPTSGLDPLGRIEIRDLVLRLKKEGKSILYCSHLLNEVEMVCDRVAVIHKGNLLRMGTMEELLSIEGELEMVVRGFNEELLSRIKEAAVDISVLDSQEALVTVGSRIHADKVIDIVRSNDNAVLVSMTDRRRSLEDLFVSIVKGGKES